MTAAFQIDDVSKRFGPRWALARLSFSLERGKALLLTGHNGSGKTTLLKLLATASFPTVGKLSVLGLDAYEGRDEIRQRVALLSHASFLYEDLTAEQNLVLLGRLLALDNVKDQAAAMLNRVGLTQRSDNPVRQFSAGMRKRLAIARLLLKRPELALLDEPFGELDPQGIAEMEKVISELASNGTTLVLATHLVDQGLALTQLRLHLQEGRAVEALA
jgi:heme exporter protein A